MMNIFILDKQVLFADGLVSLISDIPEFIVTGCSSQNDVLLDSLANRKIKPDIIILGIDNESTSDEYISLISEIRKRRYKTKFLILTSTLELSSLKKLFQLEIDGFLMKSCSKNDFYTSLSTLKNDNKYIYPKIIPLVNSILLATSYENKKIDNLTDREVEILKCVAKGFSNKEIAIELVISERTVKNHIFNLFKKIDCNDRTQATIFAIRNKIV